MKYQKLHSFDENIEMTCGDVSCATGLCCIVGLRIGRYCGLGLGNSDCINGICGMHCAFGIRPTMSHPRCASGNTES